MSDLATDQPPAGRALGQVTLDRIGLVLAVVLLWAAGAWAVGDPLTLAWEAVCSAEVTHPDSATTEINASAVVLNDL